MRALQAAGLALSLLAVPNPQLDAALTPAGASASGHGNWINAAGEYVSRTFHAREQDGVVDGTWVYHFTSPSGEKRVNKGDIDCMRIISPNEAVISGRVMSATTTTLIGQTQIFRVVDTGEGSDEPDRMSALFARPPESGITCQNFTPPNTTPIMGGNIQVRPW